ncbi:MAG: bifunctional 4-hydroxy-2-oxoglutarate aldolase/2-dehydro-3-deoxy-phosphogluconate aldolase [Boseongicola sp. SB0675_bin_26]|nr:bifunctional 4-hydroxy-2-oxoglutarate aldolase/2-dehydro-3-deoxy-phosphogluconate aldolase [Boseongicola sp. SB0675_bin_26]
MNPQEGCRETSRICQLAPVISVLTVNSSGKAARLANALVSGGLPVLEVTLRTPAALDAIRAMTKVKGGVIGAGTVLTASDVRAAKDAGAVFGVSPGATEQLLSAAETENFPIIPGSATASEAMRLLERGYTVQKFFPAEASGGAAALKALAGPLPQIKFCPTGGINMDNVGDYLDLENTMCVGGSWVAPDDLVSGGRWTEIEALAQKAASLRN